MYEVTINMTFRTSTRERAGFIVKTIYRARKKINMLDITKGNNTITSNVVPIKKG